MPQIPKLVWILVFTLVALAPFAVSQASRGA